MPTTTLFQEVTRKLRDSPKWSLALAASFGLLEAAPDASGLFPQHGFDTARVATMIIAVVLWFIAQYLITIAMVRRRFSLMGFARFVVTSLALFMPLAVAIGSAWVLPRSIGKPASAVILVVSVLFGVVLLLLLRAWPVAQALSAKWVSPLEVLQATTNFRWSLIWLPGLVGGAAKLAPAYTSARNPLETTVYFLAHGAVSAVIILGFCALAAAAWALSCRQHPRLIGDEGK